MKCRGIFAGGLMIVALALCFAAMPAVAKNHVVKEHAAPAPDPAAIPALAKFLKAGAKAYYMGAHSGLEGWFIIENGQVQMAYTTPDGKSLLTGVMFDENGANVSTAQFRELFDHNKDVKDFFQGRTQLALVKAKAAVAAASSSPGERLLGDLGNAAGVTIGAAGAPQMTMVMDPNCPHCRKTWDMLRADVLGNKLQIRMIPIGLDPADDPVAARLLEAPDPLHAWDQYVAGDKSALAGTPTAADLAAVHANHVLIDAWHIGYTPYIVYRAVDGQVKIVEGEPKDPATILADLEP